MKRATGYFDLIRLSYADQGKSGRAFSIVLFLLVVVTLMICLALATTVYQSLSVSRGDSAQSRLESSYLVNTIRLNDEADALTTGEGPEGKALVLTEHDGDSTYETRIYQYQGKIYQEYAPAVSSYDVNRATELATSETFSFTIKGNLISITTDAGTASVTLRSEQGGD